MEWASGLVEQATWIWLSEDEHGMVRGGTEGERGWCAVGRAATAGPEVAEESKQRMGEAR